MQDLVAEGRMLAHHLPLFVGQRAVLAQDGVRHRDLADVVEQGAVLQHLELLGSRPQDALAEDAAVIGDAHAVPAGHAVAPVHGPPERFEGLAIGGLEQRVQRAEVGGVRQQLLVGALELQDLPCKLGFGSLPLDVEAVELFGVRLGLGIDTRQLVCFRPREVSEIQVIRRYAHRRPQPVTSRPPAPTSGRASDRLIVPGRDGARVPPTTLRRQGRAPLPYTCRVEATLARGNVGWPR